MGKQFTSSPWGEFFCVWLLGCMFTLSNISHFPTVWSHHFVDNLWYHGPWGGSKEAHWREGHWCVLLIYQWSFCDYTRLSCFVEFWYFLFLPTESTYSHLLTHTGRKRRNQPPHREVVATNKHAFPDLMNFGTWSQCWFPPRNAVKHSHQIWHVYTGDMDSRRKGIDWSIFLCRLYEDAANQNFTMYFVLVYIPIWGFLLLWHAL